jgi:PTS system ascorbate-specific IIB component
MLKVVAACGNGMGSSQIIKMKIEKVFKKLGIQADIHHMSVGEAKSQANSYDVVFCSLSLVDNFKVKGNTKVIGLQNLLSESEIEQKIKENLVK